MHSKICVIMRCKRRKTVKQTRKRERKREREMRELTPQNAEQVAARVDYCSRNAALPAGWREGGREEEETKRQERWQEVKR